MNTVFIGYDTPDALDVKLNSILQILDREFTRIEYQGDTVHLIGGDTDINFCDDIVAAFNALHAINLNADIGTYDDSQMKRILWLSADTPEQLRACDVDRVVTEAYEQGRFYEFKKWLTHQHLKEDSRKLLNDITLKYFEDEI